MEGYNSVIAVVAEVAVDEAMKVALEKVTAVVDAGPLIHPDQALAQIQSCINDGQTCALFAEITIANGQVEQRNFDRFRLTRINEAPKSIDITFLPARPDQPPGGLGEPTAAVMVPAIANAVFAATGKRVRKLPITPEALRTA
jgi:isoquinoline 1-oxidoreductase beta subunit